MKHKLHSLDYTPKDIHEAISLLRSMEDDGVIQGIMFVCKLRGRKDLAVGAAGCCVTDRVAKIGAAGYLFGAVIDSTFSE